MEEFTIEGRERNVLGTGAAKFERRAMHVPCVIYGAGMENKHIAVPAKDIKKIYELGSFTSRKLCINLGKDRIAVIPKAVQLDIRKNTLHHIELQYLNPKENKVKVKINFLGVDSAPGIKKGGFFNIVIRHLLIKCIGADVPLVVSFDASKMYVGSKIKASDIPLPENAKLLTKPNTVIASITGRGSRDDAKAQEEEQKAK